MVKIFTEKHTMAKDYTQNNMQLLWIRKQD
jgi:hypothetical protein